MKRLACVAVLLTAMAAGAAPGPAPMIISLNPAGPPAPSPVPVSGPLRVSPGKIQILKLDGYNGPPVTWDVVLPIDDKDQPINLAIGTPMPKGSPLFGFLEGDTVAKRHLFDLDTFVVMGTGVANGKVRVRALVADGVTIKVLSEVVLRVGDDEPPPMPNPKPKPDPEPAPAKKVAWAIVVEETSQRTPDLAQILNNVKFWDGLEAKGVRSRFYDKDNKTAIANDYSANAAKVGLPALILLDAKGNEIDVIKLPATTDEIQKEVLR